MTPFLTVFLALIVATVCLALYRKFVSAGEDDIVHLAAGEERLIPQQVSLARRLATIDKLGKTLTIVTLVVGVGIASVYSYQAWVDPTSVPNIFHNFFSKTTP